MDMIKVAAMGVAAVFLAVPLKKEKQEYSLFLSIAVCICIFVYILTKMEMVLAFLRRLETLVAVDSLYLGLVLKMTGITYVAEFAVNLCKDAGYTAVGSQIENFAKMSILVVSLPVLTAFIETIGQLI